MPDVRESSNLATSSRLTAHPGQKDDQDHHGAEGHVCTTSAPVERTLPGLRGDATTSDADNLLPDQAQIVVSPASLSDTGL